MKNLKYIATTIAIIGAAIMLYFALTNKEVKTNSPEELLPEQGFVINNANDTVIETEKGMVLVIPADAFVDENGHKVTNVNFEVKEVFETTDILKAGLTTLSDGKLLETSGMFFLNAYDKVGKKLVLADDKKILAEIPNMNPREDMMLFDGEKQEDGSINWVNPKPFEKNLITYDITTLNFYPEGYLEELKYKKLKNYNGKALFKQSCASCHHPTKDGTGPALKGVKEKWEKAGDDVFKYVKNPQAQYDAGVKTALNINYQQGRMPGQVVNNEEIAAILAYADNYPESDHYDPESDKIERTNINTTDKQFTDSLYYSFARLFDEYVKEDAGQELIMLKLPILKDGDLQTKLMKKGVRFDGGYYIFNKNNVKDEIKGLKIKKMGDFESVITFLGNKYNEDNPVPIGFESFEIQFKGVMGSALRDNIGLESKDNFNTFLKECKAKDINWIIEESITDSNSLDTIGDDGYLLDESNFCTPKGINPARIQAIWNKEFNNTILATKEFETRLHVIHQAHNDALLSVYVTNIDKPLWYCDSVASTLAGSYKAQFEAFYKQKKGGVKVSDALTNKLSKYYEQKQKEVTEKSAQAYQEFETKKQKLVSDFTNKQTEKSKEEFNREMKVFNEELVVNLDEAYRQLDKKRRRGAPFVASVGLGAKNVDAYVFEATANRSTLDYTDPVTGKKAVIKYEEASVKVLNNEKFDRVFVYMIPDSLSSFNRMKTTDNINFKNNLNELFNYKMVCLGYVGEQAYLFEGKLKAKNYEVKLKKISEEKLKQKLNKNNTEGAAKKDIIADVNFYKEEVAFKKATDKIKATEELTVKIGKFLFPSLNEGCLVSRNVSFPVAVIEGSAEPQ
jgi:mono/diheme cytochrome c family protein